MVDAVFVSADRRLPEASVAGLRVSAKGEEGIEREDFGGVGFPRGVSCPISGGEISSPSLRIDAMKSHNVRNSRIGSSIELEKASKLLT